MTKKLIPLTIDRKKWVRGDIGGESRLLNKQGNMCCLGFACKALGFRESAIDDITSPESLTAMVYKPALRIEKLGKLIGSRVYEKTVLIENSEDCQSAMNINDDDKISEEDREAQLKPILKKLGFSVKFV
jgi:hypothetical protein